MLNMDVLCEAHLLELTREAARERLALQVATPPKCWRGTLSRVLRAAAEWVEPGYASPRVSNAEVVRIAR
jgi:hypothetical protein